MKTYHSLDFESQKKRLEPNDPGEYLVELEDYESLNDLIERAIIKKEPFVPQNVPGAEYDTDEDIADQLGYPQTPDKDRPAEPDVEAEESESDAERSEGKDKQNSASSDPLPVQ